MAKDATHGAERAEHLASAKALNLAVSPRHCVEISHCLRYRSTNAAKQILQDVVQLRRPIAFRRFNQDTGHKAGMAAGRFPKKAAQEFLRLIRQVEANAQVKGLDAAKLKIVKLVSNKAGIPLTGKRMRHRTKRSHIEIAVAEYTPVTSVKTREQRGEPQK